MVCKNIDLYEYFNKTKKEGERGILTLYLHDEFEEMGLDRQRPAMLICPGGSYAYCSAREGEPLAIYYLNQSFNAFVLDYTCAPDGCYPTQLLEACMAMAYIKENAKELHVLKDKVAVIGFSAGGHLAGSISTLYGEKVVKDYLLDKAVLCRPDLTVLCYPVIVNGELAHQGSIKNVSGGDASLADFLSLDKRVTSDCPPAFIWTTQNDTAVPSENSLLVALAYKKAKVPFELHIFEEGQHGLALCNDETCGDKNPILDNPQVSKWLMLCDAFLKKHGFCLPKLY